jgi:transcriptional regulator with PAS, ATPase and Fis domain
VLRDAGGRVVGGAETFRDLSEVEALRIELPPLRRRKEDIPFLVEQFVARFNRLQHKTVPGIAAEALSLLMAHDWPGNIRELENAIERAFILCNEGDIGIGHLPEELTAHVTEAWADSDVRSAHDNLDARVLRAALERNAFNRLAAAKELGIHKTTLFRRMKKLDIPLPEQDGRTRRARIR